MEDGMPWTRVSVRQLTSELQYTVSVQWTCGQGDLFACYVQDFGQQSAACFLCQRAQWRQPLGSLLTLRARPLCPLDSIT